MYNNIEFLKRSGNIEFLAVISDADQHQYVEEEADDVGVDGEGGEGPVLGVVAVLVLPDHHHLRVHQQEHHLSALPRYIEQSFRKVYHDEGAKSPIDHLQSIEGVPVLHLQDGIHKK